MKLKQNRVTAMNRAGNSEDPGRGFHLRRAFRDHAPQLVSGSRTPRPRKESAFGQDHGSNT